MQMHGHVYRLLFLLSRPRDALNKLGERDDGESLLLKAYSLLFMDNLSGAEQLFNRVDSIDTLVGKGIISMKRLRFGDAFEKLEEYRRRGSNPFLKAEALYTLMNLRILTGDTSSFDELHRELIEVSMVNDLPAYQWMAEIHRARLKVLDGDIEGAVSSLEIASKGLEERKNVGRRVLSLIQLAYYRSFMGEGHAALNILEKASTLASLTGSRLLQGLVHYYTYIVKSIMGVEDTESYNLARTLIELSEDRIMQTEVEMDTIMELIRSGELIAARREIQKLLSSLKKTDYGYKIPTLLYFLAEVELLDSNPERVLEIVEEYMENYFPGRKFLSLEMMALRSAALLKLGNKKEAYTRFLEMLRFTEEHNLYHYWTTNIEDTLAKLEPLIRHHMKVSREMEPYLLKLSLQGNLIGKKAPAINLDAASRFLDFETVQKHLNVLKQLDPKFPEIYARRLRYRIKVLGGFSISIGNRTLREEDFNRPIHVKVMKYLIINRNLNLPKEKIIEDIWGQKQTEKTHRTLNTIISHIRKILHPLGEKRNTIKGTKGEIGFYPDERFHIDAEEFERYHREGKLALFRDEEQGKELLQEALKLYTGDLLPADNHEWVSWERERLRTLYAQTAMLVAELLRKRSEIYLAIFTLEEAMYRTSDSSIYGKLIEYLDEIRLTERKSYWENYVERFIFSE